jgi:hypothetical protein
MQKIVFTMNWTLIDIILVIITLILTKYQSVFNNWRINDYKKITTVDGGKKIWYFSWYLRRNFFSLKNRKKILEVRGNRGHVARDVWVRVDFIKQFTPYIWNLPSAPILFAQIYLNLAACICALCSTYFIFSQIWVRSTLYPARPTFMKSGLNPTNQKRQKNFLYSVKIFCFL